MLAPRSLLALLIAGLFVLAPVGVGPVGSMAVGDAKPATVSQGSKKVTKKKRAKKRKQAAKKRRKRKKKPNMPRNWVWPPDTAMKEVGATCLKELTELGVDWSKAKAAKKVATPILVESMDFAGLKLTPIFRKPPFVLDCHLARAIAHAAPDVLASGITELRFSTIHEYRRVRLRGRTLNSLSRHSLGLAIDVYELVTTDGTKVVIKDDYKGSAHAHALEATLLESGQLRALLTPGNDPRSHYDHFHLEARMTIPAPKKAVKKTKRPAKKRRRK